MKKNKTKMRPITEKQLNAAVKTVQRKYQDDPPKGIWDNANRFYPSVSERCFCCASVRQPSRAFPYSLFKHCFSIQHMFNRFANKGTIDRMDIKEFKRLMKVVRPVAHAKPINIVEHLIADGYRIHPSLTLVLL